MSNKTIIGFVLAAACLAGAPIASAQTADRMVTNGPQADPGDNSPNWSPARNVRESEWYEHLLRTSPAFRMARMRKECGPIDDPVLHASCVATFGDDAAMSGSSGPTRPGLRNGAGD